MRSFFTLVLVALSIQVWAQPAGPFILPLLPYQLDALEPFIDAQTMEIHHGKHHQAYVTNLNKALAGTKYETLPLMDIMLRAEKAGGAIRNNAGGHYNHSLFWSILGKGAAFNPESKVGMAVINDLGGLDSLQKMLNKEAATRFGSGWAWLYLTTDKKLAVCSSPNQDNPIMDVSPFRGIPILGIDVWEHAYYLKYQNKRADYLSAIWNVINWNQVNENYINALANDFLVVIEKDSWTELKEFHKVMAATFHPAEEGDFKPIRQRSGEMALKAMAIQKGKIPTTFNTPEINKALTDLVAGAEKLNKAVMKNKKDKELNQQLTALHDVFHTIQGLCSH
ncbi:MAG TPA: superoxide dismutase [Saprospiraceae bacterium]|nr:superoxide dismutase [Saprospiraceae bacterium]